MNTQPIPVCRRSLGIMSSSIRVFFLRARGSAWRWLPVIVGLMCSGVEQAAAQTSSWIPRPAPPTERYSFGMAAVGTRIYVLGGRTDGPTGRPSSLVEMYDPSLVSWSSRAQMSGVARYSFGVAVVNDLLYTIGGREGIGSQERPTDYVAVYNPSSNLWSARRAMPTGRGDAAVGVVNGIIYVVGGDRTLSIVAPTAALTVVEAYNPASDQWSSVASYPFPTMGAAAVGFGGRLYVAGGYNYTRGTDETVASVHIFDPVANTWRQTGSLNSARAHFSLVEIGGRLIAVGGGASEVESYDPATGAWQVIGTATAAANRLAQAAALDGAIYSISPASSRAMRMDSFTPPPPTNAPTITAQPLSRSVPEGQSVTFSVAASGNPTSFNYVWQRLPAGSSSWITVGSGGAYSGTSTATLTVSSATLAMSGDQFRATVSNGVNPSATSSAAVLTVTPVIIGGGPPPRPGQVEVAPSSGVNHLVNLSTRGVASSGGGALIGGFVITGHGNKTLLIRGMSSALSSFGLTDLLRKPQLTVHDRDGRVIATATTQKTYTDTLVRGVVTATSAQVGAFPFNFQGGDGTQDGDTGVVVVLAAGQYTASVAPASDTDARSLNAASGLVLLEIYDVSAGTAQDQSRLVNVATRGVIDVGQKQMVVGFVVRGSGERRVLVRGIGPTLASFGVLGSATDPELKLFDGRGNTLMENDDWGIGAQADQSASLGASAGAFGMLASSKDAALIARLPAGGYTATVAPRSGGGGVGLVEVYETP